MYIRLLVVLLSSLAALVSSGTAAAAPAELVVCLRTGSTTIICV